MCVLMLQYVISCTCRQMLCTMVFFFYTSLIVFHLLAQKVATGNGSIALFPGSPVQIKTVVSQYVYHRIKLQAYMCSVSFLGINFSKVLFVEFCMVTASLYVHNDISQLSKN